MQYVLLTGWYLLNNIIFIYSLYLGPSRFTIIVARWEALKKRINVVIYNLSGKTAITENVMIDEEEISPLELRQVHATPEIPDLPPAEEDEPEPVKKEPEVEKMVVEEITFSPVEEPKQPPVTPKEAVSYTHLTLPTICSV